MADRKVPDHEHAWLLARERGEPGPVVSDARARRYAEIATLITGLPASPAGTEERAGWQADVLAAIDAEERGAARARRRHRAAAAAAFAMAAVVAIVVFARRDVPRDAAPGSQPVSRHGSLALREGSPDGATRGAPLADDRLQLRYSLEGRSPIAAAPRELHDGDTVTTGDRMRAAVTASRDATLYLGFCSHDELRIYPSRAGLRAAARARTLVPGNGDLVFDDRAGAEALYLIASRDDLAVADPQLAELVAGAAGSAAAVDCARLDRQLSRAPAVAPATSVLRGALDTTGPEPVIAADAAGIIAVRVRFVHVAASGDRGGPR